MRIPRLSRLSMQCGSIVLAFFGFMGLGLAWTQTVLASECPPLLKHSFPSVQKGEPQNLCRYQNRVILGAAVHKMLDARKSLKRAS